MSDDDEDVVPEDEGVDSFSTESKPPKIEMDLGTDVDAEDRGEAIPHKESNRGDREESVVRDEGEDRSGTATDGAPRLKKSFLSNNQVFSAKKKLRRYRETIDYIFSLPSAPRRDDYSDASMTNAVRRLLNEVRSHQKKGRDRRHELEVFLAEPFQFPAANYERKSYNVEPRDHFHSTTFDNLENLLTAHSTIDAELEKWAKGVERGFEDSLIEDAEESWRVEEEAKSKKKELKEIRAEVEKQKKMYVRYVTEIQEDEAAGNVKMKEYRERQENAKKEEKRPRLMEETAEIMEEVETIRAEKLKILFDNDDLERENAELRHSLAEMTERRLECRVDEYPGAQLKSKTKMMVGELVRLGVPKEGVNVVFESILGMADFKVEASPSLDEIEKIEEGDDVA